MAVSDIVAEIDREIAQLQHARAVLVGGSAGSGRTALARLSSDGKKKRNLTPEGRKRIAEAVKRRWAEQRKAAAK